MCCGGTGTKTVKEGFLEEVTAEPNLKPSACADQKKKGANLRRVGSLKGVAAGRGLWWKAHTALYDRGVGCMWML